MGEVKEGASGESPVSADQEKAVLSCAGYRCPIERSIYFPKSYPEIKVLEKTILDFGPYKILQLNWEAEALQSLIFIIGEPSDIDSQQVDQGTKGGWEFPLAAIPPISAIGKKSDGTTFQIPL